MMARAHQALGRLLMDGGLPPEVDKILMQAAQMLVEKKKGETGEEPLPEQKGPPMPPGTEEEEDPDAEGLEEDPEAAGQDPKAFPPKKGFPPKPGLTKGKAPPFPPKK